MPNDFDIAIDTREMDAMLGSMDNKLAKGAVRGALQAAGNVMLVPMKILCPEKTAESDESSNSLPPGVLRESLTTQVQVGRVRPPRVKVGCPIETNHVGWLIEEGFDNVKSKTHISGKHFISGAFDESAEEAVNVLLVELGKVLETREETAGEQ